MKVWVFWVGDYEDTRMVGPFATEALAQDALDAYNKYPVSHFSDPTQHATVRPMTIKGEAETVAIIATRRWESVNEYD